MTRFSAPTADLKGLVLLTTEQCSQHFLAQSHWEAMNAVEAMAWEGCKEVLEALEGIIDRKWISQDSPICLITA